MRFKIFKIFQLLFVMTIFLILSSTMVFAYDISLYPTDVSNSVENGYDVVSKTYALSPTDDPSKIQKTSFKLYGEDFTFSEIIKKDVSENRTENHTEPVTINTDSKELDKILGVLKDTMDYSKDGYTGTLKLDVSSISCSVAGYKNNSYTATRNRTYPGFSSQDTSLVPKTITDGGITYSLKNVTFKATNADSIDSEEIPTSYNANATYTASVSSKSVTGYVTRANYVGVINKSDVGKVIYTVTFVGDKVVKPTPTPLPKATIDTNAQTKSSTKFDFSWVAPILTTGLIAVIFGGLLFLTYYLFIFRNVTIFNQSDLEYKKIAKLHIGLKNPKLVINLNNIPVDRIKSGNFVIEISGRLITLLSSKDLYVVYNGAENLHRVKQGYEGSRYQFESNFLGTDENEDEVEGAYYESDKPDL